MPITVADATRNVISVSGVDLEPRLRGPDPNAKLVGGPGFEPGASRSRTVRAAGLRQPPLVPKPEFYPDLLAPACVPVCPTARLPRAGTRRAGNVHSGARVSRHVRPLTWRSWSLR